jgi:hypothetical protein
VSRESRERQTDRWTDRQTDQEREIEPSCPAKCVTSQYLHTFWTFAKMNVFLETVLQLMW